ncbi:MAG TPA: DUF1996 domain-containing protein [Candidatus Saccharimonadales bacterium]|nr:DUF1996 domain-containing protein [Candidatus Saccharimonadales bacterium]
MNRSRTARSTKTNRKKLFWYRKNIILLCLIFISIGLLGGIWFVFYGHAETARPEWNVECDVDHYAKDDPIRFPNQSGASPMNSFFGNKTTNAASTGASINAGSSNCNYISQYDHSAYWVPSIMYTNPDGSTGQYTNSGATNVVYYSRPGGTNGPKVQPFPKGLKMLAGNPSATTAQSTSVVLFNCSGGPESAALMTNCPGTASNPLRGNITFPSCWDGVHLDSADHKSHMAYANTTTGACPADHPVSLPQILYDLHWPTMGGGPNYFLSSGGIYSMYAEFIEGWDTRLEQGLIDNCINNAQNSCHLVNVGSNGAVTINGSSSALFNINNYSSTPPPSPPPISSSGDLNNDSHVNLVDLSIMLSKWGSNDATADLNHDGAVNVTDLSILLSHYGT